MQVRDRIISAIGDQRGSDAADAICDVCVELFDTDGAAISIIFDGASAATLGASSPAARTFDEVQFTLGEGPCLDSVATGQAVLIDDLRQSAQPWIAYASAMLELKVLSVFAVPLRASTVYVVAVDLFRHR